MQNPETQNLQSEGHYFGSISPTAMARKRVMSECLILLVEIATFVEPEENQHVTTLFEPFQLTWY